MKISAFSIPLLALSLTFAAAASAHKKNYAAMRPGLWSLAFGLVDEDAGSVGVWRMVTARTSVGIDMPISYIHSNLDRDQTASRDGALVEADNTESQRRSLAVRLRPALKRYLRTPSRTAPFLYSGFEIGFAGGDDINNRAEERGSGRTNDNWTFTLGAHFGLGVDWSPTDAISIGGYTGLGLNYRHQETGAKIVRQSGSDTEPIIHKDNIVNTTRSYGVDTLVSNLTLQIYF